MGISLKRKFFLDSQNCKNIISVMYFAGGGGGKQREGAAMSMCDNQKKPRVVLPWDTCGDSLFGTLELI